MTKWFVAGISVNPAKAWGNLANILNNKGDTEGAEAAYRSALSHRGNMADVHYNLGILLQVCVHPIDFTSFSTIILLTTTSITNPTALRNASSYFVCFH